MLGGGVCVTSWAALSRVLSPPIHRSQRNYQLAQEWMQRLEDHLELQRFLQDCHEVGPGPLSPPPHPQIIQEGRGRGAGSKFACRESQLGAGLGVVDPRDGCCR